MMTFQRFKFYRMTLGLCLEVLLALHFCNFTLPFSFLLLGATPVRGSPPLAAYEEVSF